MAILNKQQMKEFKDKFYARSIIYSFDKITNIQDTGMDYDGDLDYVIILDGKKQILKRVLQIRKNGYYKVNRLHHKVRTQKKWIKKYGYSFYVKKEK